MAPEQWKAGWARSTRARISSRWASCSTKHGRAKLFKGDGPKELFRAVTIDPIAPPSSKVQGYPKSLEAVVMKALAKSPWCASRAPARCAKALLDVARKERWPIGNKVVADILRQALGTGRDRAAVAFGGRG